MNWRVELFRIWVLFSALWFIAWGTYGFLEWRQTTFIVRTPIGLQFQVLARTRTSNEDVLALVRNSDAAEKRLEDCSKQFGPECQHAQSLKMPDNFPFVRILLEIIVAPIAALALGVAAIWITAKIGHLAAKLSND